MNTDFPFWHLATYDLDKLQRAVDTHDLQYVTKILASGDISERNLHHLLVDLSQNGWVEDINRLAEAGCPVNLLIAAKCPISQMTTVVLELAVSRGSVECVKALINAGCRISLNAFAVATNNCERVVRNFGVGSWRYRLTDAGRDPYPADLSPWAVLSEDWHAHYVDDDDDTKKK